MTDALPQPDYRTLTDGMYEHHIQRALWQRHRSGARALLPNYTPHGWYECDLYVVTNRLYAVEYEVKLSLVDFRADFRKRDKHARLKARTSVAVPSRFFYAVPAGLVSKTDVPEYAGLVYMRWSSENPARRLFAPRITVVRPAPRLNDNRVTEKRINAMRRAAYYRFWNERFRFEEYRRAMIAAQESGCTYARVGT